MNAGNFNRELVEEFELAAADLSSFDDIGVTDGDGSSYLSLWSRPRPLVAFSGAETPAPLTQQPTLLLIKITNADDNDVRLALCDKLRPLLAGHRGNVGTGWMGPLPQPKT